jgi:hypothetical protein
VNARGEGRGTWLADIPSDCFTAAVASKDERALQISAATET